MLTAGDEYPIHQAAEPVRHAATSDRNFYDRSYFNMHACTGEIFLVFGMGVYPNLGVHDAFVLVRRGTGHHVVRASRVLGDRMDMRCGPLSVEIVEPLRRIRVRCDPNEWDLDFDLLWSGSVPAYEEPRHQVRRHGRIYFDTARFAQTGCWTGHLNLRGETFEVVPDRWWGTRDRSWGVRPVGEPEPAGIRAEDPLFFNLWNYAPMKFADHSILYIVQEWADGSRTMQEAVRIWADPDRPVENLGRPEHAHRFHPGTRMVASSVLSFPEAPGGAFDVTVTHLLDAHVGIGTGYGFDADWRHGMYQGAEVVQGLSLDTVEDSERFLGIVDSVARFETSEGQVGFGLHETLLIGPHDRYGFESLLGVP